VVGHDGSLLVVGRATARASGSRLRYVLGGLAGGLMGVAAQSLSRRIVGGSSGPMSPAMSETQTTTDHEEIRRWVEEHGGRPATVRGTGNGAGVLRIDFPGGAGEEALEPISWDEWFKKFDENRLALLYQEEKAGGEDSTFAKLVRREGS
jgi:hypothetical protein